METDTRSGASPSRAKQSGALASIPAGSTSPRSRKEPRNEHRDRRRGEHGQVDRDATWQDRRARGSRGSGPRQGRRRGGRDRRGRRPQRRGAGGRAGFGGGRARTLVPGQTEFAREHEAELRGKVVVDISNPLDESWTRLATDPSTSSAELLAEALPESRIVKAFNTTHAPALFDGQVDEVPLDVLLASDDGDAKSQVSELVRAAGLRPIDAGALDNARLLERLTAFQVELSQRYDLDFRLTFKLLPADLPK